MIPGGIEVNWFAEIRFILEANYADDFQVSFKRRWDFENKIKPGGIEKYQSHEMG